ncbi:MAG: tetratricopeptide repeat protein [Flavobacteriaceae bacterium]|nr:tetratricopeptide repeat protein [Flavobacteriaceae bacterium]
MRCKLLLLLLFATPSLYSQGNCTIYPEGSEEREACQLCHQAIEFPQGSRESQILFDQAIEIGPNYAWAYYQKSIPYLKRGFLTEGLAILNKAVALNPLDYLCYRAYWYWQYKNYELCVNDLETYYAMPNAFIQQTPGGEKNMKNILALAYAKTNRLSQGIDIMEKHINSFETDSDIDLTDYHTLGVLYFKSNQFEKAIEAFQKQLSLIEITDTHYFLGLTFEKTQNYSEALVALNKALESLDQPNRYSNYNAGFPVYRNDIIGLLNTIQPKPKKE